MREEGVSIYLSLVGSQEASDVWMVTVVGGFFSGHPMKGGHRRKWTNERGGYLPFAGTEQGSERYRDSRVVGGFFSGHPMKGGHWRKWTNERGGNFNIPLAGEEQGSERCRDSS